MTAERNDRLLLNAALDGELDAAGMLDFEARLAAEPALAAEYRRLSALRRAMKARLPRESAPEALRARVAAMAQAPTPAPQAARRARFSSASYRALAASLMLGVLLGAGGYGLIAQVPGGGDIDRAIVAGFIRGRLSGQPVDIATSDRHTVKPWFSGKVAGATTVVDLKADGFPLVGGRLDVIKGEPVATLVYQRREHQIAVSELPGAARPSGPALETRDGYSLVKWSDGSRRYIAISDIPATELEAFSADFRNAVAAEREEPVKK